MNSVINTFRLLLISMILISSGLRADNILESSILQFQQERFYFPVGTESLVHKDCQFVILNENDTIHTGNVDESYIGVSYSYPVDSLYDTLQLDNYKVFIQPATIDSLSKIDIGYISPNQISYEGFIDLDYRIKYHRYNNNFEMILDFESGNLDAFYSFSQYHTNLGNTSTISFPAPYYIAIIPNLSSQIYHNGFLTTSLYYRYDPGLMPILFNGDDCQTINCLVYNDKLCSRYYPYDPYRGQVLLKQYRPLPKTITIGITDQSWGKTAEYYADILSRDRIRTVIEKKNEKCDFTLAPVPIYRNKTIKSLRYIHHLLSQDTSKGNDINENLRIIGNYIKSAETAADTLNLISERFQRLAETGLWDEIGVFPLYQPTIFFTTHKNITGHTTDSTGFIDQNKLYKIILPESCTEVTP